MSTLKITAVQVSPHWHDARANRQLFDERLAAIDEPTDCVVLPEMFTTGFTMDAAAHAETMDGESVAWLADKARALDAAVCGSLIIEEDGRYYNRFVLAEAGGRLHCYDKRHLFRLANEGQHYSAGRERVVFELGGVRICPQVCYDLRFPVWSRSRGDYDLLVYVANWPEPRHFAWRTLLRARAIENQCCAVGVNRCGRDGNDIPYAGGSAVVDWLGHDVVDLGEREGMATVELDFDRQREFRERYAFQEDADDFEIRI